MIKGSGKAAQLPFGSPRKNPPPISLEGQLWQGRCALVMPLHW